MSISLASVLHITQNNTKRQIQLSQEEIKACKGGLSREEEKWLNVGLSLLCLQMTFRWFRG